jgi:hypothetical protein
LNSRPRPKPCANQPGALPRPAKGLQLADLASLDGRTSI